MYKLYVFLKRGFVSLTSYRMAFVLTLLSTFMGAVQFYYIGRFVGEGREYPLLAPYGGNLLAYLIIGTTFMTFVGVSLDSFSSAIRVEQQMGTLEFLLVSETSLGAVLLYSGVWNFVNAAISTAIVLSIFVFAFGVRLNADIALTFTILLLVMITIGGIGWMSAGVIMVTKQGDPISWVFGTILSLLSGATFPVELLPRWLQSISAILPTTHGLVALRKALLMHASLPDVWSQVLTLVFTGCITVPVGLLIFKWGFHQARIQGSLSEY